MKKILIVGKDSYIGDSFSNYLKDDKDFAIDIIDSFDNNWKQADFSNYDVVYHVAGIAHIKETKNNKDSYYKINRDLAFEVANEAKIKGVKHFIFLSTMSVYGIESGIINIDTIPTPTNSYGKSKYEAEQLLTSLIDKSFVVSIIRPPMVYGKGCKGNYQRLRTLALRLPIFPNISNMRSMIYIDNLCEFVRILIINGNSGLFFPQNNDFVCTSEMVKLIASYNNKKIKLTKIFNPIIKLLRINVIKKVFGDLVYAKEMEIDTKTNFISFQDSIIATEIKHRG